MFRLSSSAGRLTRQGGAIVANAGSLAGSTAVNSLLGFVYWWVTARQFSPAAVGMAAAAVSAMSLLGTVGMLGLGTVLIGELPKQPKDAPRLIATALALAGIAGGVLGIAFALTVPGVFGELAPLARDGWAVLVFAAGVSLTALSMVLDQALLGMLKGGQQLARNALFAIAKLAALVVVGMMSSRDLGLGIYATWPIGILISLAVVFARAARRQTGLGSCLPQWALLRKLSRKAITHHLLNLAVLSPGLVLPVLVTALLSPALNAGFYVAWMLAMFVFVGPVALAQVLYATGSAKPQELGGQARLTASLALGIGVAGNILSSVLAHHLLSLFGHSYSADAALTLQILCLGVFPSIARDHYVAIRRVRGKIGTTAFFVATGAVVELLLAAAGAQVAGLPGLAAGWVGGVGIEALLMAPTVWRALRLPGLRWAGIPALKAALLRAENSE